MAPEISLNPAGGALRVGTSVTLNCRATARPDPTYSWFLDGNELSVDVYGESARTSRLNFTLTPERRGNYYCVATNVAGTDRTTTAMITTTGTNHTHLITPTLLSILQYSWEIMSM